MVSNHIELVEVKLGQLFASPYQPRSQMSEEVIAGIKKAILDEGSYPVSMAIVVRRLAGGGHEIVSGHHRAQAARDAGLATAWAYVEEMDDKTAAVKVAASNNHSAMTGIEHGAHLHMIQSDFGVTPREYAEGFGKTQNWAYGVLWAYEVLRSIGGIKSKYAKVQYQILADLRRVESPRLPQEDLWRLILDIAIEEKSTVRVMKDTLIHIRNGINVREAFDMSNGKVIERAAEAARTKKERHRQSVVEGMRESREVRERLSAAAMLPSRSADDDDIPLDSHTAAKKKYRHSKLLLRSQVDVYERMFGHLIEDREAFDKAVMAQYETLVEHTRGQKVEL